MPNTILITGGASRIGARIATYFVKKGKKVICTYLNSIPIIDAINNISYYKLDLNDPSAIENFWNNIDTHIDVIIHNAAYFKSDSLTDIDNSTIMNHMNVNSVGAMLMTKRFISQNGIIVINLTDAWAKNYPKNFLSYSLSKMMLTNFTEHLNKNYYDQIQAYSIELGFTLYKKGQSLSFFNKNKSIYPSDIKTLLSLIDIILSSDKITPGIIDLTKWKKAP